MARRRGILFVLFLLVLLPSGSRDARADDVLPSAPLTPPPGEVVPVPTPSPEVRHGEPVSPDVVPPVPVWRWRRFSTADYAVMVSGGAVMLAAAIIPPQPKHARGPVLFDSAVRRALRAPSLQQRYTFRDVSDVGASIAVTWPFLVDALASAWWLHGSRDTAEQMALLDLQALAVTGAVQGVTNTLVSRERPYASDCGSALPANALDCEGSFRYRSFFSAHSAFSFTGAALVCVHHLEQDLLGSPWDALSCAGGYVVAATTATFRVVGDVHYATDVVTGALVGSLVGYGVPLLHYAGGDIGLIKTGAATLQVVPSANGAGVLGVF